MKRVIVSALVNALSFILNSCNSVDSPTSLSINLMLENVSFIEISINLSSTYPSIQNSNYYKQT